MLLFLHLLTNWSERTDQNRKRHKKLKLIILKTQTIKQQMIKLKRKEKKREKVHFFFSNTTGKTSILSLLITYNPLRNNIVMYQFLKRLRTLQRSLSTYFKAEQSNNILPLSHHRSPPSPSLNAFAGLTSHRHYQYRHHQKPSWISRKIVHLENNRVVRRLVTTILSKDE